MSDIIRLHDDPHRHTQTLLPWYVSGAIEAEDLAIVEAHLADCLECRSDLRWEHALAREISTMPTGERGGGALPHGRVETAASARRSGRRRALPSFFRRPVAMGWVIAAQAASLLLMLGAIAAENPQAPKRYAALGAPATVAGANIIVMFNPTSPERAFRAALVESGARLVDGPTAASAYLLHVAANERAGALAKLRSNRHVVMAEPLDGPPGR